MHERLQPVQQARPGDVWQLVSLADMAAAERLWRELDARSTSAFVWFQSFEWCYRWMQHHAGPRTTPQVLMLTEADRATAVLPMMLQHHGFGLVRRRILGEPHTQYANVLTETGRLNDLQLTALAGALAAAGGIDVSQFGMVPAGSALAEVLAQTQERTAGADNASCQLDLTPYASARQYEQQLDKEAARGLRRALKKVEGIGAPTLDVLRPGMDGYRLAIARCLAMKKRWLEATGRISLGLDHGDHAAFLNSLGIASGPHPDAGCDGPLVFVLNAGEQPLAVEFGLLQRGHYYSYLGAYDWSQRHLGAGKLQMHKTTCWLIEQGVKTMDLLGNPSGYKEDFASRTTRLFSFETGHTLKGRLYSEVWQKRARPQAKELFGRLPVSWRTRLTALRKPEPASRG